MNYFLGIFPNDKALYKISKLVPEVGRVLDAQGIPFTPVKSENLHITVLYLGRKMPFLRKQSTNLRLKRLYFKPFVVGVDEVKLGLGRAARETVFGVVNSGAEDLREMVYQLDESLGFERTQTFMPHMTLGRVAKDLSDEEFHNLGQNFNEISKRFLAQEIKFFVNSIYLVESDLHSYKLCKKFSAS
ncbi:2'-5' RNA ligase family protein [Candidatus Dojkabacteria bacterium]|uniref:2'-5' RNA ligase family protein n=1 Tax=Candidatus Dojkabacteria bacterium TaxID=2099670 RepID=A0A955HXM7_9BACT|nr:2'-5' RNA ligase family protein [Candidatus Dojkabacteria bacterium]